MAKLATTLIEERLSELGISVAPVAQDKSAPDVLLITTRKGRLSRTKVSKEEEQEEEKVKVLVNSNVLKSECDFFREWFLAHEQQKARDKHQHAVVSGMVDNLMGNVRQEGEIWHAVSNLVDGVMSNVRVANTRKTKEAEAPPPAVPPPPNERNDHAKDYMEDAAAEDEEGVQYVVIKMLNWSFPVTVAILEWIYTRVSHIDIKDVSRVYEAADRMIFSSLTGAIRDFDSQHYYRHALACNGLRDALLCLSRRAACPELSGLRLLCESLQKSPGFFNMSLELAAVPYRNERDLVPEGVFTLNGIPVCSLRQSSSSAIRQYITYVRESYYTRVRMLRQRRCTSGRAVSWRIMDLGGDGATCCYTVFHSIADAVGRAARAAGMLSMPVKRESFSLRMVTGSMMSSILRMALQKGTSSDIQLRVKEERGSGYYIKGPSYCFSLLLQGDPSAILVGAKAIPRDIVGRAALRIRSPSLRTFRALLPMLTSFGVDLEARTMYILKTLPCIIRILEFATGLSSDGLVPFDAERRVVELVEPTDPF